MRVVGGAPPPPPGFAPQGSKNGPRGGRFWGSGRGVRRALQTDPGGVADPPNPEDQSPEGGCWGCPHYPPAWPVRASGPLGREERHRVERRRAHGRGVASASRATRTATTCHRRSCRDAVRCDMGSLHRYRHRLASLRIASALPSHRMLRIASHRDDIALTSRRSRHLAPLSRRTRLMDSDRHRMAYAVAIHERPRRGPAWPPGGPQRGLPGGPKTDPEMGRKSVDFGAPWGPPKTAIFDPPGGPPPGPPAPGEISGNFPRGEIPENSPPAGEKNRE